MVKAKSEAKAADTSVHSKGCTKCHAVKPLAEFRLRSRGGRSKHEGTCRQCRAEDEARRRKTDSTYREYQKEYSRKYRRDGSNWLYLLVTSAKRRAKEAGLDFSISDEWVTAHLSQTTCPVTGFSFRYGGGKPTKGVADPLAPSIDRIDHTKGYAEDNIRIVCWWANMAKSTLTEAEFRMMISAAATRMLH